MVKVSLNNSTEICIQCGSKCCKSTPPALTSQDTRRIREQTPHKNWLHKMKNGAFVISKKPNSQECIFLADNGLCNIYEFRPLDCKLFPFFVKIQEKNPGTFNIEWRVWFCPLTNKFGLEQLYNNARLIVIQILKDQPETLFEYQKAMYGSGGYKRKHFWRKETITLL